MDFMIVVIFLTMALANIVALGLLTVLMIKGDM